MLKLFKPKKYSGFKRDMKELKAESLSLQKHLHDDKIDDRLWKSPGKFTKQKPYSGT